MRFYFDESGDFSRQDKPPFDFGVVAAIILPDSLYPRAEHAFRNFMSQLQSTERDGGGEPKGSQLADSSRDSFVQLLESFPDLISYVVILDLTATREDIYANLSGGLRDTLNEQASDLIHEKMRDSVTLLGKQVAKLSSVQFSHLFAIGQAVLGSFNASVLHFFEREHGHHFDSMSFHVDHITRQQKLVFDVLIKRWIDTWTHYEPVTLVKEVHVPGHPLIDNFTIDGQLSVNKIVNDNLAFVDSRTSVGVQMADILANTFYRVLSSPDDELTDLAARIVACSHRFPWASIRLFTFGDRSEKHHNAHVDRLIKSIEHRIGYEYLPGGLPPYPGDEIA